MSTRPGWTAGNTRADKNCCLSQRRQQHTHIHDQGRVADGTVQVCGCCTGHKRSRGGWNRPTHYNIIHHGSLSLCFGRIKRHVYYYYCYPRPFSARDHHYSIACGTREFEQWRVRTLRIQQHVGRRSGLKSPIPHNTISLTPSLKHHTNLFFIPHSPY
jgi:hypothetical protein